MSHRYILSSVKQSMTLTACCFMWGLLSNQSSQIWTQRGSDWLQNAANPGLFQIRLTKMYWNLIWKSTGFVSFGANLTHFGAKPDITVVQSDPDVVLIRFDRYRVWINERSVSISPVTSEYFHVGSLIIMFYCNEHAHSIRWLGDSIMFCLVSTRLSFINIKQWVGFKLSGHS